MQKSSQDSCLFYIILPAVKRCSNKTKHTAEERIRAQQNCSMADLLPGEGRHGRAIGAGVGSPSLRSCCGTQHRAARPRSWNPAGRWIFQMVHLKECVKNSTQEPLQHSNSQRIGTFCRYVDPWSQPASALPINYLSIHKHSCFLVILCHRPSSD